LATMSVFTKTLGFGGKRYLFLAEGFALNRYHHHHTPTLSSITQTQLTTRFSTTTSNGTGSKDDSINNERLFSEEINVLYDSKCNVCKLEMDWLVSRDISLHGPENRKLKLTDLEDNFDASDPCNGGIDYAAGMAAIYAVRHDGTVFKGVPVFELAYDQVGLGWIWKVNRISFVRRFLEWGYEIFARNRTKITRGASLEELLALNDAKKKELDDGNCESCATKAKQIS